jgi:hypothetical protein
VATDLPLALAPVAALVGICTILNMPLRDPMLPSEDISPVYSTPTIKLRTPEDNLTPWQYMAVTWMAPLIREGYKRQLDDEDVWDLPWEFKHARLHHTFRDLPGSVTRRIFVANGMDLVRTCSMNLVRLAASEFRTSSNVRRCMTNCDSSIHSGPTSASACFNERSHGAQECHHHIRYTECGRTTRIGATERVQSMVSASRVRTF